MLRTSLRQATLTSLTISSLLSAATAQDGDKTNLAKAKDPARTKQEQPGATVDGLPKFLLMVPQGDVQMGIDSKDLFECAEQSVSPFKPADAVKQPERFKKALACTASTLGLAKVPVDAFLLGQAPVTYGFYDVYISWKRAHGKKGRPPLVEWQEGEAEDFKKHQEDIIREFPKDPLGVLLYHQRHGHELPYKLQDKGGKSIANLPVTGVTYEEANEFAGWLGMRLPFEREWTRAARGDGTNRWPWGVGQKDDTFSAKQLGYLGLDKNANQAPLPAGTIANATGPFGHQDMFGRTWQLMSGIGYGPINGKDAFQAEWQHTQKSKLATFLANHAPWEDGAVIAKGGSWLSVQDPITLMIDARVPVGLTDALPGVGFRLAKSLKPGFDMIYSLVRGTYNRGAFAQGQELSEADQIGAERYELNNDGFPTAYHAVSFVPVGWLTNEKTADLAKLLERSLTTPLLIGTFATTEKLIDPEVPSGFYTVLFRKEGVTKELAEAMKLGHKEILTALKTKGKGGEETPADEKQEKKGSWREIIAKFGITEEDLTPKEAANGVKFVRIDGVQVPTDTDCFLLLSSVEGKVVAAIQGTKHKPANVQPFATELTFGKGEKDKTSAEFRLSIQVKSTEPKRAAEFHFRLNIDCAMPSAETMWRMPASAAAPETPSTTHK